MEENNNGREYWNRIILEENNIGRE